MDFFGKVALASLIWGFALMICNPFFEGKKRLIAMIACLIIGTVAFVFS